jgi:SAM-dependent methyltransferase
MTYREVAYADMPRHKGYARRLALWLMTRYKIGARERLLDIGCGDGMFLYAFESWGVNAYGVDLLPPEDKQIKKADIEKGIPLADNSMDVVFAKSVIEHVGNLAVVLSESKRVLLPGGRIILMTPEWRFCYRGFYDDPTHIRPCSLRGLTDLLKMLGFTNVKGELFRPSGVLLKYPKWRWLLVAIATVLPYGWLGYLRFAAPRHIMSIVCATKE